MKMRKSHKRFLWGTAISYAIAEALSLIWHLANGQQPAWWVRLLIVMGVLAVWDGIQHFRLSRAFWNVMTAWEMPARGEDPDEFWETD